MADALGTVAEPAIGGETDPAQPMYTLAGEVTGEKAKRTRYGERRWAFVVRGGKDSGLSALSARQPRSGSAPAHFRSLNRNR